MIFHKKINVMKRRKINKRLIIKVMKDKHAVQNSRFNKDIDKPLSEKTINRFKNYQYAVPWQISSEQ